MQVLKDVVLQPGGTFYSEHKNFTKEDIRYKVLPDGVKGFYFSANWVSLLILHTHIFSFYLLSDSDQMWNKHTRHDFKLTFILKQNG